MTRRPGSSYPLYDAGPVTVAALGRWVCDGSHRWPTLDLIFRDRWLAGPSCTGGRALRARRLSVPLPWVPWHFQYRHKWARPAWSLLNRLYWAWARAGRTGAPS